MKKTMAVSFSNDRTDGLDSLMTDFVNNNKGIEIINVSHSSCWDAENKSIHYSVVMAYSYEDESNKYNRR